MKKKINPSTDIPNAVESEMYILGASALERDTFAKVISLITVDDLFKPENQIIFQAMHELFSTDKPIDIVSVGMQLRTTGNQALVPKMMELTNHVGSGANVEYHCLLIIQQSVKRKLSTHATELFTRVMDDEIDIFETMEWAEGNMLNFRQKTTINQTVDWNKSVTELTNKLLSGETDIFEMKPTHLTELDNLLNGGFGKGNLVIIAGRPGMGKTALMMQSALNQALDKIPVAIFTFEMTKTDIILRLQNNVTQLNSYEIKHLQSITHRESLAQGGKIIASLPITMNDTSVMNIIELRGKIKEYVSKYGVEVVYIDYLGLISKIQGFKGEERHHIGLITRMLKITAKELNIAIVLLSQLNRGAESRPDKRPQLSDLRESGDIEQDADIVMFTFRPYYYYSVDKNDKWLNINGQDTKNLMTVICAKNRQGETGDIDLFCDMQYFHIKSANFVQNKTYNTTVTDDDFRF
jgi:replicative DNA helicase